MKLERENKKKQRGGSMLAISGVIGLIMVIVQVG
jgi:hypothetical protein